MHGTSNSCIHSYYPLSSLNTFYSTHIHSTHYWIIEVLQCQAPLMMLRNISEQNGHQAVTSRSIFAGRKMQKISNK